MTATQPLTDRQREVLDCIANLTLAGGPPTVREIMDYFGWAQKNRPRLVVAVGRSAPRWVSCIGSTEDRAGF